ncbi:MAG: peptidoglycan DD-metalloendopeptidase family protein [Syntrophales bacterium]
MAKNHYTFLIVPQKKSSVKKISASSTLVRAFFAVMALAVVSAAYMIYDYLRTKNDAFELSYLKRLTESQKEQINHLAAKVSDFEKKMEDLKQLDQKIRTMANLNRKQAKNQVLGIGGIMPENNEDQSVERISRNIDRLLQDASYQENSFKELLDYLKKRESILASTPSIWPVLGWVTSEFGSRMSPYGDRSEFHKGIDIAARIGKEVLAPADGIVSEVVHRPDMGHYITIDHMRGIRTGYAHLLKSTVTKGKSVKRGDVIGYVGNSGRSTGSHLHYSVTLNGVPVNPRRYLQ